MTKDYTLVRRLYAWVGFIAILYAGYALYQYVVNDKVVDCAIPPQKTLYEPILLELEQPLEVKKAEASTSTTEDDTLNEIDFVAGGQIARTIFGARITGYNTVESQTDSTPCIAASGENICGRHDAVACPSTLPFGTEVMIYGRIYECVDRTHNNYEGRFDISCDKDFDCPATVTGYADVWVLN